MAVSPRVVTEDRLISWDGVTQRLPKGQVMDVPPDSALERAIGLQYLVPLGATSALPSAEQLVEPPAKEAPAGKPQQEESPAVPPKPVAAAAPKAASAAPAKSDDKAGDP